MPWMNGPVVVYHGTDNLSATRIRSSGILPAYFKSATDFGAGFYVTTVLHQAKQWANQKCRRTSGTQNAEVLEYQLPRNTIETLRHLSFITDSGDYYDFVAYCRGAAPNHGPVPRAAAYDVVYGLVSLWPQLLVLANCDQILFSDPSKVTEFATPSQSIRPPNLNKYF
jgi:hypothetical protein